VSLRRQATDTSRMNIRVSYADFRVFFNLTVENQRIACTMRQWFPRSPCSRI